MILKRLFIQITILKQGIYRLALKNQVNNSTKLIGWEFTSRIKFCGVVVNTGSVIKVLEWLDLIRYYDRALLNKFFKALIKYSEPDKLFFVNLSRKSLDAATVRYLIDACNKHQINTNQICLEITESARLGRNRARTARQSAIALKKAGFLLAIDDWSEREQSIIFWNVFSFLKIVCSQDFGSNQDKVWRGKFVAGANNLSVVLENIESPDDFYLALAANIKIGQGFYFDKPCPIED